MARGGVAHPWPKTVRAQSSPERQVADREGVGYHGSREASEVNRL